MKDWSSAFPRAAYANQLSNLLSLFPVIVIQSRYRIDEQICQKTIYIWTNEITRENLTVLASLSAFRDKHISRITRVFTGIRTANEQNERRFPSWNKVLPLAKTNIFIRHACRLISHDVSMQRPIRFEGRGRRTTYHVLTFGIARLEFSVARKSLVSTKYRIVALLATLSYDLSS